MGALFTLTILSLPVQPIIRADGKTAKAMAARDVKIDLDMIYLLLGWLQNDNNNKSCWDILKGNTVAGLGKKSGIVMFNCDELWKGTPLFLSADYADFRRFFSCFLNLRLSALSVDQ